MQPNYSEQYKRQQQDYQRSRNPFEYGQQVAQRRYSEILAGLDAQRMGAQQTYGDMYQAARQRAIGQRAMGGPTLSGGMGQQRRDFISALEMQELGKIQQAGAKTQADLYAQGQAAFSNAQLEGQQATQMELQNRQAQFALTQQKQAILNDTKLTEEEKQQQLAALEGGGPGAISPVQKSQTIGNMLISGAGVTAGGAAAVTGVVRAAGGFKAATGALAAVKGTIGAKAVAGVTAAAAKSAFTATTLGKAYVAAGGAVTKTAIGKLTAAAVVKKIGFGATVKALGVGFGAKAAAGLGVLTASTGGTALLVIGAIVAVTAITGLVLNALKV